MTTCTGNPTDRQLLERFATRRDGEAFAQLVHRHGPLVLGVCRQVLRQEQDAEDAFQATFLVLARKAGSIRSAEALPNWLYGVANRLATRMKAAAVRRQTREVALVKPPLSEPGPGGEVADLGPILFEEIGRLPDKYRIPFVLCYLEGKTNEQAAQQLDCPPGTVFSRLARARERLRQRLTRRGLAVTGGVLAATLSSLSERASAAVPQGLEATTVLGALRFGAGNLGSPSNIPARVVTLARWGVWSLARCKLRMAGGLLVLVALVGVLCVLFLRPRPVAESVQSRLQGTWAAATMNMGGVPIPGPQAQLTFEGNQMTLLGVSGTYRIDAGKNPMEMDVTIQGVETPWIFKIDGDDLTLSVLQPPDGPPGNGPPRPADFSPQPGKNVITFKRLRP
jgi:RNA polymerase sigma factor (sigma-70 family)